MAEKEVVNRSQAIREYLNSVKPSDRGPRAVSEALKAKGLSVSPQLVSQVKTSLNKKTSSKKKGRVYDSSFSKKIKKSRPDWFQLESVDTLISAKNLLKSVGGDLNAAKKNLEIISKLLS
jgi:hypothetical protein